MIICVGQNLISPMDLFRALAMNCNAPVNKEKGAEAKDWKAGKPVRVLRNYKGAKHSKYAPEEGNRQVSNIFREKKVSKSALI